jgi:hypothetical protein
MRSAARQDIAHALPPGTIVQSSLSAAIFGCAEAAKIVGDIG